MSDIEELRQRRMRELMQRQAQQQMQDQAQRQMQEDQIAAQIKLIINQILTPEARQRLANIRVARPELARQVEILLIKLYQAGQLPKQLSDEAFKGLLEKILPPKKETSIKKI